MRISDWSSDVCSSDLSCRWRASTDDRYHAATQTFLPATSRAGSAKSRSAAQPRSRARWRESAHARPPATVSVCGCVWSADRPRSEEHTSELQSLMRISYAVFCLKKKIRYYIQRHTTSPNLINTEKSQKQ